MKLIVAAFGIAVLCSVGASARADDTKTRTTKVEVKDGKDITTTGCVERAGRDYYLAPVGGGATQYRLVGSDDLSKHVGERVEISGKASDLGGAKVKTETKTKIDVEHGKDKEVRTRTESKGDISGMPLLGVKSLKKLSSSCG